MLKIKPLIMIAIMLTLSSCATLQQMHQEWLLKHCLINAAYNKGLTDGLTPQINPDSDYASECSHDNDKLNTAYLKGFGEGIKSRPQEININKNTTVNGSGSGSVTAPSGYYH